jgi:hypothetical protein
VTQRQVDHKKRHIKEQSPNMRRQQEMGDTNGDKEVTLRLRNVGADTTLHDLVELFARQQFRVQSAVVQLSDADDGRMTEGFITLPESEAVAARKWADGQTWRGNVLDASLPGDYR